MMGIRKSSSKFITETERLKFRPFEMEDFSSLCVLDKDPEVRQFFPDGVLTEDQIKKNIEKNIKSWEHLGYSDFIVIEKETDLFIGRAGFSNYQDSDIEVGYLFLKAAWGKGYATEAVQGLLKWAASNLNTNRIIAFAPINHLASQKVLEKSGMKYFQTEKHKGIDCRFYEILLSSII